MAKKRKIWKSNALEVSNMRTVDKIRAVLVSVAKGDFCREDAEKLYDILAGQFEKVEKLESDDEILEMLTWFLNCSDYFDISEDDDKLLDDVNNLFSNVISLFMEKAKLCENRGYILDLMHDLLVNSAGEVVRLEVFWGVQDFLSAEETERLAENVLSTISAHELENEKEIFSGLLDLADGANNPVLYEKIAFLKDSTRSNKTLVDVANTYYIAGDISNANRLMDEVKNPVDSDEEEFLDLKIGILFKEEKEKEALEQAEKLYEKFPKECHLKNLCQVVSPSRREELLNSHEKFRLGVYVSSEYINLLVILGEWDRLSGYLERYEKEIPMMEDFTREFLASRIEEMNHPELAQKLRKI